MSSVQRCGENAEAKALKSREAQEDTPIGQSEARRVMCVFAGDSGIEPQSVSSASSESRGGEGGSSIDKWLVDLLMMFPE